MGKNFSMGISILFPWERTDPWDIRFFSMGFGPVPMGFWLLPMGM
jgi:hypothetical protein